MYYCNSIEYIPCSLHVDFFLFLAPSPDAVAPKHVSLPLSCFILACKISVWLFKLSSMVSKMPWKLKQ